jgi:hypothetical protein
MNEMKTGILKTVGGFVPVGLDPVDGSPRWVFEFDGSFRYTLLMIASQIRPFEHLMFPKEHDCRAFLDAGEWKKSGCFYKYP